jgi:hypothetical protein
MMIGEAVAAAAGAAGAAATPMGVVPVVLAALPVFSGQKKTSALYNYIILLHSPPRGGGALLRAAEVGRGFHTTYIYRGTSLSAE